MAIDVSGSASTSSGSGTGTAVSVTLPPTINSGDAITLYVASTGAPTYSGTTAGYSNNPLANGTTAKMTVFWKSAAGTEGGTTWSTTLSAAQAWDIIAVVTPGGTIDGSLGTGSTGTSSSPASSSGTATAGPIWAISAVCGVGAADGSAVTFTAPSGYILFGQVTTTRTASNANIGLALAYKPQTSTTIASATWTASQSVGYVAEVNDLKVNGTSTLSKPTSDTTSVSDTPTRTAAHPRATSDTTSVSDAVTYQLSKVRTTSDTTTVSDAVTRAVALPRGPSDTVTTSDTPTRAAALPRGTSDTTTVSDSAAGAFSRARGATDTVTTSDSPARALALPRGTTDTLTTSDTATRGAQAFARATSETLTVTDNPTAAVIPAPVNPNNPNWPLTSVQIDFVDGVSAGPPMALAHWTDITSRVTGETLTRGRAYELASAEAGQLTLTVSDRDEYLNPGNAASPYNTSGNRLLPYRPVVWCAAWPNPAASAVPLNAVNDVNSHHPVAPVTTTDSTMEWASGVGHWANGLTGSAVNQVTTIAQSAAQHQQGTHSLLLTLPAMTAATYYGTVLAVPTMPGQTTTVSAYAFIPGAGGVPTASLVVLQPDGTSLTVGGANTTTTTGSWVRVRTTFTATTWVTYVALCGLAGSSQTSGKQVYWDAVQVEIAATVGTYTSTGLGIYPQFTGYVERWPVRWGSSGMHGWSDLECVDAAAMATRTNLISATRGQLTVDGNATGGYYWPLDEGRSAAQSNPGQTYGQLAAGAATGTGLYLSVMPLGAAGGSVAGVSSPWLDSEPWVQFNPAAAADMGTYLIGQFPSTVLGTIECAFATTSTQAQCLMSVYNAATNEFWTIEMDAAGLLYTNYYGSSTTTVVSTAAYNDGAARWVAAQWTGSVFNLFVNGTLVASSGAVTLVSGAYTTTLVAYPRVTTQYQFAGQIGHIFVSPSNNAAMLTTHANVAVDNAAETPTARTARLVTLAGFTPTVIGPVQGVGQLLMGTLQGLAGTTLTAALQMVADTCDGALYCDTGGQLRIEGFADIAIRTTPRAALGENNGEVSYAGDIAYDLDSQYIYNTAQVTQASPLGGSGAVVTQTDAPSTAAYGTSSLQLSVNPAQPDAVTSRAFWAIGQYAQPLQRLDHVTVDAASQPGAWPTILGVDLQQRLTVSRRALTAGVTMTGDFYVEHESLTVSPTSWAMTYQASPAALHQAWIIGDSTYGVVGVTTIPAYY